jgi:hypothetical protein
MGHPTIARAGKVQDDLLYCVAQRNLFGLLGWLSQDVLPGIVPGAIDEAPAHRGDEWTWAAYPDMPVQLAHVAVEGELAQRFF